MRRARAPLAVALALALLAGARVPAARADDAAPPPGAQRDEVEALLRALGKPARAEVVRRLVLQPEIRDESYALMLVRAFIAAGGVAASDGLLALAAHRDPRVREWALRGVQEVGVRTSCGVEDARRALESPYARLRRNACWALGVVGDAQDVPVLLAIARDPNDPVADPALAAVQRLAGLRGARYRTVARVEAWWEASRDRLHRETEEALAGLEARTPESLLPMHREILYREGWVDPALVGERARAWLRGQDAALRLEALRAVEALRLGDLADAVQEALPYEGDDACLVAGGRAAAAIGVPLPDEVAARIRRAEARQAVRPLPAEQGIGARDTARAPDDGTR